MAWPLAVTSTIRSSLMPDVPTMDEEGLKGFDATSWFGLLAPAGTPKDIVAKLNAASVKALASAEMRERLAAQERNFSDTAGSAPPGH